MVNGKQEPLNVEHEGEMPYGHWRIAPDNNYALQYFRAVAWNPASEYTLDLPDSPNLSLYHFINRILRACIDT